MTCSKCDFEKSKVVESRDADSGDSIRRRRECMKCGHRFTTYERFELPDMVVIKSGGSREAFDREKVFRGIQRACDKTTVTADQMEAVVDQVERTLRNSGEREVEAKRIGQIIMDELERLDEIAYIRFASVYLRFDNLEMLERMIKKLQKKGKQEVTRKSADTVKAAA